MNEPSPFKRCSSHARPLEGNVVDVTVAILGLKTLLWKQEFSNSSILLKFRDTSGTFLQGKVDFLASVTASLLRCATL